MVARNPFHYDVDSREAIPMQTIEATELKARLKSGAELALVDVREETDFYTGHLLFAANLPLSRLEQLLDDLIPRRAAPIVVCDAGGGLAERAAQKLAWLGYSDVAILKGGNASWAGVGGQLFAGVNVPSKGFGEYIEHALGTPRITAEELQAKIECNEDMVILDSRPWEEFRLMSLPGGQDCPGAELAYRAREVAPDPKTLIVVNCAGRTRSIIGAQSLINAGVPNPVVALKDGTMGWQLAGYKVAEKNDRCAVPISERTLHAAQAAAIDVSNRAGVKLADAATLERFRAERASRTLCVLDVRTPEEFAQGHLPDAVHAFGGQLVQTTDKYIIVRGARIVLVDDTEVRARMTASWLRQMGWEDVYVLAGGIAGGRDLVTGPRKARMLGVDLVSPATLSPATLHADLAAGRAMVIDLADPRRFKSGHIAGAWYAVRSKLPDGLEKFDQSAVLAFTSSDGQLARLAAADVTATTGRTTVALAGGTAAWKAAGLPMESGGERKLHPRVESWSPYDPENRTREAMLDYLTWEVDLYDRVKLEEAVNFRTLAPKPVP